MAIIIPDTPIEAPFVVPENRPEVTEEPEPRGTTSDPRFPDVSWDGWAQHGGGHVPEDYEWTSNPKQFQDDLMGEWIPPS
ncbi:hypothetical protein [Vitiosangium sp. GDMCC 1.1324]|uniref:hypothetical protein n=1 Tax=Vitiosangium sp. (strain GDMCC 1.1324) TaxID=2138576 RepID=UPI000D377957|nr:hypothetical protein [Vitiosangium sp. GDMCC 1.1324]PTL80045.1 hypothetical protein DAT35_32045 [Vitiosangium sp. GDMCC 1.1324]